MKKHLNNPYFKIVGLIAILFAYDYIVNFFVHIIDRIALTHHNILIGNILVIIIITVASILIFITVSKDLKKLKATAPQISDKRKKVLLVAISISACVGITIAIAFLILTHLLL